MISPKCGEECPEFKPGLLTERCIACPHMDERVELESKIAKEIVEELTKHA